MNQPINGERGEALSYNKRPTNKYRRNGGIRNSLIGKHESNNQDRQDPLIGAN